MLLDAVTFENAGRFSLFAASICAKKIKRTKCSGVEYGYGPHGAENPIAREIARQLRVEMNSSNSMGQGVPASALQETK